MEAQAAMSTKTQRGRGGGGDGENNKECQYERKGAGTVDKKLIGGEGGRRVRVFFSDPIPPQACLEVIMHDTAEGC